MENCGTREIHLKLDELINANQTARNKFGELERLSDADLAKMEEHLTAVRKQRSMLG